MNVPSICEIIDFLTALLGATALVLSFYPLSQLYQIQEDAARGDTTFAVKYGKDGVQTAFRVLFGSGVLLRLFSLGLRSLWWISTGLLCAICIGRYVDNALQAANEELGYARVMQLKYTAGISFSALMLVALVEGM